MTVKRKFKLLFTCRQLFFYCSYTVRRVGGAKNKSLQHERRRNVFSLFSPQHGVRQAVKTRGGFTAWFHKFKVRFRLRGLGQQPEKTREQEQEEELEQTQRHKRHRRVSRRRQAPGEDHGVSLVSRV